MMRIDDVPVQLIDLPPITAEHMESWLPDAVRGADAALLLIDPTSAVLPEDVVDVELRLAAVKIQRIVISRVVS